MTNRRKFLMQGSFAATALLFTKPFKAIAGMSAPFTASNASFSHITFFHTADISAKKIAQTKNFTIRNNNIVLLHVGKEKTDNAIQFDASAVELKEKWNNSYTIINKNGIKTGVIALPDHESEVCGRANAIAAYLKNTEDCKLVVFMSSLGFKNKNKLDDIHLAAKTKHIDIIISKYDTKIASQTYIARNKNKDEVIVQHQNEKEATAGKIKILFNEKGVRNGVSF